MFDPRLKDNLAAALEAELGPGVALSIGRLQVTLSALEAERGRVAQDVVREAARSVARELHGRFDLPAAEAGGEHRTPRRGAR